MPSVYQRENLEAMLGLFLEAQGHPLPQHSKAKSASALSRFLNIHRWSTQQVIRTTRNYSDLAPIRITLDLVKSSAIKLQLFFDFYRKNRDFRVITVCLIYIKFSWCKM